MEERKKRKRGGSDFDGGQRFGERMLIPQGSSGKSHSFYSLSGQTGGAAEIQHNPPDASFLFSFHFTLYSSFSL